jgi:ParB family chromosome partitioning protein
MGMGQVKVLPVERIFATATNRRNDREDKDGIAALAASIKSVGLLQPIVVRPQGIGDEAYEIIAGERRWKAVKSLGEKEIRCVVVAAEDSAAETMRIVENLQRKDAHPLDEAEGYRYLVEKGGMDFDQIAGEVGKSASYVAQRLKLVDLVPAAQKLFKQGVLNVAHCGHIARLEPGYQEQVLAWLKKMAHNDVSAKDVQFYIQRSIHTQLAEATFDLKDADLVPEAGACAECRKRSGFEPMLFADIGKKDTCLDPRCFNTKLDAFVAKQEARLKEQGRKVVKVHGRDTSYQEKQTGPKAEEYYNYSLAKPSDPDAVALLVVTGPKRGMYYFGTRNLVAGQQNLSPREQQKRREEQARKREENRKRRSVSEQLFAQVRREVEKAKRIPPDVVRLMTERALGMLWGSRAEAVGKVMGIAGKQNTLRTKLLKASPEIQLSLLAVMAVMEARERMDYSESARMAAALIKARKIKPEPKPARKPAAKKAAKAKKAARK